MIYSVLRHRLLGHGRVESRVERGAAAPVEGRLVFVHVDGSVVHVARPVDAQLHRLVREGQRLRARLHRLRPRQAQVRRRPCPLPTIVTFICKAHTYGYGTYLAAST